MAAFRDILRHIAIEIAEKKRKCHHKRAHSISKGETCLAVFEGPRRSRKNYCVPCAKEILHRAEAKFTEINKSLLAKLGSDTPTE